MKKRLFCLLMALVLLCTVIPAPAKAAQGGKLVALTFDDGPGPYTERLLNGLKDRGVKVTFFMLGSRADSYTSLVKRAFDEGHEVACHSWDHPCLTKLSDSNVRSQFTRSYAALNKACGAGTSYLTRAPYGDANDRVKGIVNTPFVYWSVDIRDWEDRDATIVRDRIIKQACDGAIILVHDIHSTTVDGALQAISSLQAKGYEFVTVSELFRRRNVSMSNAKTYYSCKTNDVDLGPVQEPTITYEPVSGGVQVRISAQSGATIYYCTDGSRITNESHKYTGPFTVTKECTVTAVAAYKLNGGRSATVTKKISGVSNKPVAKTPGMTIENGVLTLKTESKGGSLLYTLDDTNPAVLARVYSGPVTIAPGTVVRAITGGADYQYSPEVKLYYSKNGNVFADVFPQNWYCDAIDQAVTLKLMNGLGDNCYGPNNPVTRGMLVTLLYRYAGEPLQDGYDRTNTFSDVSNGEYYSAAVEWAYREGIVNGYPNGTFCPNQTVTREELCKMICCMMSYQGHKLNENTNCLGRFSDQKRIGKWAIPYVGAVVNAGLVQGDSAGTIRPNGTATRAEAATILLRMRDIEQ